MYKHALLIGKFYPPHVGHHHLIETALRECDKVTVVAMHSSVENIPVELRKQWLEEIHPDATILTAKDDTPVYYTNETWEWFLDALMGSLGRARYENEISSYPNIVYSGEEYAPEFAKRLLGRYEQQAPIVGDYANAYPSTVAYRIVPREEIGADISATLIRSDPAANWSLLSGPVRADLCKRVVVCGAESSGTTTLAKGLGNYYATTVVPEYGRHFDWAVGKHHKWIAGDFDHISVSQHQWENQLAQLSENGLLICDTDEFATAMFSAIYLEEGLQYIADWAAQTPANLYIVTSHKGIEFEDDGTRLNSGQRPWMTDWLHEHLPRGKVIGVQGNHQTRMKQAIWNIDQLLAAGWNIAEPLEYRGNQEEVVEQVAINA